MIDVPTPSNSPIPATPVPAFYHCLDEFEDSEVGQLKRALRVGGTCSLPDPSSASGSIYHHLDFTLNRSNWAANINRKLNSFTSTNSATSDEELPNTLSIYQAKNVLEVLIDMQFQPDKLLSSADGGITFTFRQDEKYADVECDNSGEILAITSDGQLEPDVWSVEPDQISLSLDKIYDFIANPPSSTNAASRPTA